MGLDWLDPGHIINSYGNAALWITLAIVFAECGLLLGFFLPGDTLLFSVGVLTANNVMDQPIWLSCLVLSFGAVAGNVAGYEIGHKVGPRIFSSDKVRPLRPEHVERTQAFFDKYGAPAIILARFVPIVRTVITVVAGVAHMDRRRYFALSAVGGALWVFSITLLGYFLGTVPFVRDHVEPHLDLVILAIVAVSVLPVAAHLLMERRRRHQTAADEPTTDRGTGRTDTVDEGPAAATTPSDA